MDFCHLLGGQKSRLGPFHNCSLLWTNCWITFCCILRISTFCVWDKGTIGPVRLLHVNWACYAWVAPVTATLLYLSFLFSLSPSSIFLFLSVSFGPPSLSLSFSFFPSFSVSVPSLSLSAVCTCISNFLRSLFVSSSFLSCLLLSLSVFLSISPLFPHFTSLPQSPNSLPLSCVLFSSLYSRNSLSLGLSLFCPPVSFSSVSTIRSANSQPHLPNPLPAVRFSTQTHPIQQTSVEVSFYHSGPLLRNRRYTRIPSHFWFFLFPILCIVSQEEFLRTCLAHSMQHSETETLTDERDLYLSTFHWQIRSHLGRRFPTDLRDLEIGT